MNSFAVFMYFNLQKQAYEWMHCLDKMNNKYMQNKMDDAYKANRKLIEGIERELEKFGEEYNDQFWKDSEYFSKMLELIRKGETKEKKEEMIKLLRCYLDGDLRVIDESKDVDNKV